jgi:hypothetical protein
MIDVTQPCPTAYGFKVSAQATMDESKEKVLAAVSKAIGKIGARFVADKALPEEGQCHWLIRVFV